MHMYVLDNPCDNPVPCFPLPPSRIFCMLGDMVENDDGIVEVNMAAGEVENVAYQERN